MRRCISRRRDNWVKTVMLAAVCVNWYNPLVWVMAKYLSADLEAACDAAVLGTMDAEERQGYAYSLLAIAITGNRTALLYGAFSKTEVERRIKKVFCVIRKLRSSHWQLLSACFSVRLQYLRL